MKAIKRTVAGLLATLMFASCFSFNFAFGADNYTDDEAIAVSKVNAANIMTGTDNGFEPSKTLTRAEAAAIVVRMKGVPASQVEGAKGNTLFTDVPASSWAAGYINAASAMGIISGVGNGLFLPEREVSIVEFSAMAIRALGAGKLVDSIGTWPTNYVNFATEEKLFDGVLKAYTAPATRMDVAFMVVNTIEANMWEKTQVTNTSEVTYKKQEDKTLLGSVLKVTEYESLKVDSVDTKEREVTFTGYAEKAVSVDNFDVAENVELATLRPGMEVDVWAKVEDKEIIRIATAEKSKVAKVEFSKIEKINLKDNEITLIVGGKEKTYDYTLDDTATTNVNEATKFSVNTLSDPSSLSAEGHTRSGADTVACTVCKAKANEDCTATLTNGSALLKKGAFFGTAVLDGNTVETIYAEIYTERGVVKEVKNDNIYFENSKVKSSTTPSKIDMDNDDKEYVVTKNGKEIDITDIEKGDALYFYEDNDRMVIAVNNKYVEGTAKQVSAEKYVKVDGTKYELAIPSVEIEAGSEVKLYLNAADKVTMYEVIDGAIDSSVAIVKSFRKTTATHEGGDGNWEIVLVQLDGTELETKIVDLEESMEKLNEKLTTDYTSVSTLEEDLKNAELVPTHTRSGADTVACDKCGALANAPCNALPEEVRPDLVGSLIRYTLDGGNVVIREFYNTNLTTNDTYTSYDKEKIDYVSGTYKDKTGKINTLRLTEDTTIFVVKEVSSASKAKYSVKLEEVKFEDLGESTIKGYVYDVNPDTNNVSVLVITSNSTVNRVTDENYAVVLEVAGYKGEEDDYSDEAVLVLADGSVVEVPVHDDCDTIEAGDLIEAFIEDGKLVDLNVKLANDATTGITEVNIANFNGNGTVKVISASSTHNYVDTTTADEKCDTCQQAEGECLYAGTVDVKDIVDDCIFVVKEDGNYAKGTEGDVPDVVIEDSSAVKFSQKDIVKIYEVDNTEVTGEKNIVAILYFKD